jgi:hypothetical protein
MDVSVAVWFFVSFVTPPPQPEIANTLKIKIHNVAGKNDFFMFHLLKVTLFNL